MALINVKEHCRMLSESSNYAYNEEFLELKQVTISMRLVTRMKIRIRDEKKV